MQPEISQRTASWYFCFGGIILSSFLIPLLTLGAAIATASFDKPLGAPSNEVRIYYGAIKNGEFWFPAFTRLNADGSEYECRLKRLHLGTMHESDSGISIRNEFLAPLWTDDGFCASTSTMRYRIDDGRLIDFCPLPKRSPTFYSDLFRYNGQLSSIREDEQGGYRLIHNIDGEWADGPRIRLPGFDYQWRIDDQGCEVFDRRSGPLKSAIPQSAFVMVNVLEHHGQLYVFHSDQMQTSYRIGFEFDENRINDQSDEASSPRIDVSAWKPLFSLDVTQSQQYITRDVDGLIACGVKAPNLLQGQTARGVIQVLRDDDQWHELQGLQELDSASPYYVVADQFSRKSLVITENQCWGAATFHFVENDTVLPAFYVTRGEMPIYLARWGVVGIGIILAWLSHILALVIGLRWLRGWRTEVFYEFGNQLVILATSKERFKLGVINMAFVALFVIPLIAVQAEVFGGWKWIPATELNLCETLFGIERECIESVTKGTAPRELSSKLSSFAATQKTLFPLYISEVIAGFAMWIGVQFYWGKTPGEWWTKTCVMQTNLRPRELGAIVLRTLFYWIDVPLFITPLPAFISMAFSNRLQRWGDRVADTIVIRAHSIREI